MITSSMLRLACASALAAGSMGWVHAQQPAAPAYEREIEALEANLQAGLAKRDRPLLETLITDPFAWVHASDGRVDTRESWLRAAARGMALTGQRSVRTEHGSQWMAYGGTEPHTVVRVTRVRLADEAAKRESWLRQSHTLVRGSDGQWRLAMGQGVLMYEGPPLDKALHARYTGTFVLEDGRVLKMAWIDDSLMATLPNGVMTQIFLASPTEEATRTVGAGRLKFAPDANGVPSEASLWRGEDVQWRAKRKADSDK
ncbi:hypothetical protein BWI17_21325 [Betaproteobacteria bacterium GR16-43]|nr:hypothetical protein BWI17_21325 [Betaproteobacteria bacterium GR16-43]